MSLIEHLDGVKNYIYNLIYVMIFVSPMLVLQIKGKEFFLWIFLFCTKNDLIKRRTFGGGGSGLGGGETDPAAHGHKKTEQSDGLSRFCFKDELHPSPPLLQKWHPHRDSNPSCRDENPVS